MISTLVPGFSSRKNISVPRNVAVSGGRRSSGVFSSHLKQPLRCFPRLSLEPSAVIAWTSSVNANKVTAKRRHGALGRRRHCLSRPRVKIRRFSISVQRWETQNPPLGVDLNPQKRTKLRPVIWSSLWLYIFSLNSGLLVKTLLTEYKFDVNLASCQINKFRCVVGSVRLHTENT